MFTNLIEKAKKLAYNVWDKIRKFFKDSEVIVFARLQAVAGIVGTYLMWLSQNQNMQDAIQSLFQPKYIPIWVLGMGLMTETLRRFRATDL